MLVLALADGCAPAAASPTSPPRCRVEALLGHRPGRSPPTCTRCARTPGRRRAPPTSARCWPTRPIVAATAGDTARCRTPTRCAARRRCTAPRATPSRTPRRSPTASSRRRSTTRWSCPTAGSRRNGNFHGAPSATCSTSSPSRSPTSASMSERRTDRMLDVVALSTACRLPGRPTPGVDSGLMIAQYTQAALVAEMKRLAAPASVDSIPSSAMQEDHVSMGWRAARKLRRSPRRLRRRARDRARLTAARALDLRAPLEPRRRRPPPREPTASAPSRRRDPARPLARTGDRGGRRTASQRRPAGRSRVAGRGTVGE